MLSPRYLLSKIFVGWRVWLTNWARFHLDVRDAWRRCCCCHGVTPGSVAYEHQCNRREGGPSFILRRRGAPLSRLWRTQRSASQDSEARRSVPSNDALPFALVTGSACSAWGQAAAAFRMASATCGRISAAQEHPKAATCGLSQASFNEDFNSRSLCLCMLY